jgi:hypothetical protein
MVGIYKDMDIVLNEQQILILENNYEAWGCNLFEVKSEKREWCMNAQSKINNKKSKIQEQIDRIGKHLREDMNLSYSEKVKYYTEGDPFFNENVSNLKSAEELILPTCEKAKDTFDDFKSKLAEKFLFVDKENDKYTYNQLTKLNTNYTALSYLLTEFRSRKGLVGESFDQIFTKYFENPPNSLDESPFFNLIIEYFSKREEAVNIMSGVLKTIKGTSDIGAESEKSAFKILSEHFDEENIKVFSGDFSWPDFLGIDMLVLEQDLGWGWVPVQVKTNIDKCYGNKKFCKNICIGKDKITKKWKIKIYDGEKEINPSQI